MSWSTIGCITCLLHLVATVVNFAVVSSNKLHINIVVPGFLGFNVTTSLSYNGPAVDTGMQALRETYPHFNWTSTFVSDEKVSGCATLQDNVQVMLAHWYYTQRDSQSLTAIVTPGCTETVFLNQLAAAWNILLITSAASDNSIKDRQRSSTWITTTTYPPANEVYCSVLAKLRWRRVYVVVDRYDPAQYFTYAANRVTPRLKACGVQFTQGNFSSNEETTTQSVVIRRVLEEFNKTARILLYFGREQGLRVFLIEASHLGLTSGEHVYVVPLPWHSKHFWDFRWQQLDVDDQLVREAYRSVILLTLIDESRFTSSSIQRLQSAWRTLSEYTYDNSQLQYGLPLPTLISTHAAFELIGIVINETVDPLAWQPGAIGNGSFLASKMLNRTFNQLQVGPWSMTAFGHGTFQSHANYFDMKTGVFQTFLKSSLNNDDEFLWSAVAEGRWFGGMTFPSDEPHCGFDGKRDICSAQTRTEEIRWAAASTLSCIALIISTVTCIMVRKKTAWRAADHDWWLLDPLETPPPIYPVYYALCTRQRDALW